MASKMMAGLKAKAAEAGKAKQAAKSAMADKMKATAEAASARRSADMDKAKQAASQKSAMADKAKPYTDALDRAIKAKQAAPARPTERIPRPAGTVSPNAAKMVGKPFGGMGGGMGARPTGSTSGGMGGSAPARPTSTARPAMTPQVKQGLLDMSNKLRATPMKKGGKTKK